MKCNVLRKSSYEELKYNAEVTMTDTLSQYLLEECYAMVKHIAADGKEIPKSATLIMSSNKQNCDKLEILDKEVLKLHKELSKKIAPARPKTVWLLYKESQKAKWLNFLGPVDLIRRLMLAALVSLVLFIALSLSSEINIENIGNGIYDQHGFILFIVLSFYLASASLGASFSNLFQANQYIIDNTFDPKYESAYWIRYVLGIIAGILLAVVIPMPEVVEGDTTASAHFAVVTRPVLAMLGGFSAALVYRILNRLVFAVESIFIGQQPNAGIKKIAEMNATLDAEKAGAKQKITNELLKLKGSLITNKSKEELTSEIDKTITSLED